MNAVNSQKSSLLPKYVLVVLDDDLISYLDFKREGLATLLGTWVEWLVKKLSEIVKTRLSQLPLKSRKVIPFFLLSDCSKPYPFFKRTECTTH